MGLGTNTDVNILALPQYKNITKGLQESLRYNREMERRKGEDLTQALKDYTPTAEKKDIAKALTQTKQELDQASMERMQQSFANVKLNKEYEEQRKLNDDAYRTAKAKFGIQYDEKGNVDTEAFLKTPEGQKFQDQSNNLQAKYKNYFEGINGSRGYDIEMETASKQAQAQFEAGYDPDKLKTSMQDKIVNSGIGLEKADVASTLAAKQYQAIPLTERQKTIQDFQLKGALANSKSQRDMLAEDAKVKFRDTGVTIVNGKMSTAAYKNKSIAEKSQDTTDAIAHIQDKITDVSIFHPDNDDLLTDLIQPLYSTYKDVSPHTINNIALTRIERQYFGGKIIPKKDYEKIEKDVGEMAEQLRSGQIKANNRNIETFGGITAKERNARLTSIKAEENKSMTDIMAQFAGKGNKTTAQSNLQGTIGRINSLTNDAPKTNTKKNTGGSGRTSLFQNDESIIGKAMNSKKPGDLAKSLTENQDEFTKIFDSLSKPQQKSITKVLSNKASQKVYDSLGNIDITKTKEENLKTIEEKISKAPDSSVAAKLGHEYISKYTEDLDKASKKHAMDAWNVIDSNASDFEKTQAYIKLSGMGINFSLTGLLRGAGGVAGVLGTILSDSRKNLQNFFNEDNVKSQRQINKEKYLELEKDRINSSK